MDTATRLPASQMGAVRLRPRVLLAAMRPRQWGKNLLVLAAPAAAGVLFDAGVLIHAGLAFLTFTLAASGTYLVNDAIDAPADRLHPRKRLRTVASGRMSARVAVGLGVVMMLLALVPAAAVGSVAFVVSVLAYLALTTSYSMWLKHVVVVDLVTVAVGFVIRAVAGGFAANVPVTQWFLTVSFFGALFVVSAKRYGEHQRLGDVAASHRSTLSRYSTFYSQHVMTLSSGVTLSAYGLWAFQHGFPAQTWFLVSFVFLATVLLRFALLVHAGASDDPVDLVWKDVPLRILVFLWIGLVLAGVEFS